MKKVVGSVILIVWLVILAKYVIPFTFRIYVKIFDPLFSAWIRTQETEANNFAIKGINIVSIIVIHTFVFVFLFVLVVKLLQKFYLKEDIKFFKDFFKTNTQSQ